jgi:hypothetical protein
VSEMKDDPLAQDGSWGIVRYLRGRGRIPEKDECHFDGWYSVRSIAKEIYDQWCKRYPNWIVALVKQDEVKFQTGADLNDKIKRARNAAEMAREK